MPLTVQSAASFPQQTIRRSPQNKKRKKKQSFSLKCLYICIVAYYYYTRWIHDPLLQICGKKNNGIGNKTMTQTCSHFGVLTSHCVRKSRERNRIKSVLFINIVLGRRSIRFIIICAPISTYYTLHPFEASIIII